MLYPIHLGRTISVADRNIWQAMSRNLIYSVCQMQNSFSKRNIFTNICIGLQMGDLYNLSLQTSLIFNQVFSYLQLIFYWILVAQRSVNACTLIKILCKMITDAHWAVCFCNISFFRCKISGSINQIDRFINEWMNTNNTGSFKANGW